jgi:hypothetical protein
MKPSQQRDTSIITLYRDGKGLQYIARLYDLGVARIRQIVGIVVTQDFFERQRENRLRADAMVCWYRTGMTMREIGERYGLSRGRVHQIIAKHNRRERWRQENKPPKKVLARALPPQGLTLKPGAIWHTWYLDPSRRPSHGDQAPATQSRTRPGDLQDAQVWDVERQDRQAVRPVRHPRSANRGA